MISFQQVGKTYPDGTVAVAATDLTADSGRITVLVGPSGSGKTTLLRMVNRMIEPTSGSILIDGVDVRSKPAPELRRGIGYVIQNAGLFPHRTVLANVMTVPRLLGWSKEKARERAMELLLTVGLEADHAKRYPFQLSGGQQQRVGVARALAADPPVLLMDEPFSAVDPVVRKDLQTELLRIQSELEKTILFVTHDIDEAILLGDRVAVLNTGGTLEQFDTPSELLAHPKNEFVEGFLGVDRGVRRLSFFSSGAVPLRPEPVVAVDAPPQEVLARKGTQPWLLVVDAETKPLGWLPAQQVPADGDLSRVPAADLVSYGHAFTVEAESLRAALDSAVLSPSSRAVGVDADGRVVGVASVEELVPAIRAAQDGSSPENGR
ncbi:MAG: ATP-binding cassette domain-containing protein [Catenulispora sp.]|nr:ATP-binding cassette domain-containing protein [Catenulispora sp.]